MNDAIANLLRAARSASATLSHAYHQGSLTGDLAEEAHSDYQRLDAAIAALSGVSAPVGESTCKGQNCKAAKSNGYRHSSECRFEYAQNLASGVESVEIGVTLDDSVSCVEWRGQRIALQPAAPSAPVGVEEQRCSEPCGDAMTTGDCPCTAASEDGLQADLVYLRNGELLDRDARTNLRAIADRIERRLAASGQGVEDTNGR